MNPILLKRVLVNNQECKTIPEVLNNNSNEPSFYPHSINPHSIKINKCSGSCNNINHPYAKLYLPDVVKNTNVKVFNLMPRTNETRHIEWHEICKCKCKLDASFCNDKQHWSKYNCRCKCKELIDKGRCDKGFIWNLSNWENECDKSCEVGEYLDYENCKCIKKVDKLVEECSKNIDENEMIHSSTLNDYGNVCNSCTIYIVLFVIAFLITIGISSAFIYFHWYLKRSNTDVYTNTNINSGVKTETLIY